MSIWWILISLGFLMLIMSTLYSSFYCKFSRCQAGLIYFNFKILEVFGRMGGSMKSGSSHLIVVLFIPMLVCNLMGLIPGFYSLTGNFGIVFYFVMFFWGMGSISMLGSPAACYNSFKPAGIGGFLGVLVLILEALSWLYRPVVLGLRLMVNMICGHLLLMLLAGAFSYSVSLMGGLWFFMYMPLLGLFLFFEIFVAVLQSYIFAVLVSYSWGGSQQESGWCWVVRWLYDSDD
nr:ATP synthase F0 subunit 6 [Propeamussium sp. mt1]